MKQQIVRAFQKTLVPDSQTIKEGTNTLIELKNQEQYCLNLMDIVDDSNLKEEIRQAALAQLKLNVEKRWRKPKNTTNKVIIEYLSESQKCKIRDHLFPALVRCNRQNKFIMLYKKIISLVIGYEHKNWMPTEIVIVSLQEYAANPEILFHILHYIMSVASSFELSMEDERVIFENFAHRIFSMLLELVKVYASNSELLFLICKIYWKSIHMEIGDKMKQVTEQWMFVFKEILDYNNQEFIGKHQRFQKFSPQFYYFHTKKWATRIVFRYFQKHANSKYHKKNAAYADHWYSKYGQGFVDSIASQISTPCIAKTKYFQIRSLTCVAEFKPEFIIKYAPNLLYNDLIPFLQINREDQKLAEQDPIELLKKQDDPCMQFTNTKNASMQLWKALSEIGGKMSTDFRSTPGPFLMQNMKFIEKNLASTNLLEKQMAMFLLCKLRIIIINIKQIKDVLPLLLEKFILTEFKNSVLFLRARAVEIFIQYGSLQFSSEAALNIAVQGVFLALTQESNPIVNIKAASAFNCLLKHKEAIILVKPYLTKILETYIKMLEKYDMEDIVASLEGIVTHFSGEIGPYAIDLVKHLCSIFFKYSKVDIEKINNEENYDGEVEIAAAGCIQAIKQILNSAITKDNLVDIEIYIVELLSYSFTVEGNDYVEDAISLLIVYMSKLPAITPALWFFYSCTIYYMIGFVFPTSKIEVAPKILKDQQLIFDNLKSSDPNYQFIEHALPVLRIYITKGIVTLCSKQDMFDVGLFQLLLILVDRLYVKSQPKSVIQKISASTILMHLLETVRPMSVQIMTMIFQIARFNFEKMKSKSLKLVNCQLISLCIFNTAKEAFKVIDSLNYWQRIETEFKHYQSSFEQDWERKRIILGLSTILIIKQRSEKLAPRLLNLFKILVKVLLKSIREQKEEDEEEEQEENKNNDFFHENWQDGSEDSEPWDQNRDEYYHNPLSKVNEFLYFESCLKKMQETEPQLYVQVVGQLSEKQTAEIQNFIVALRTQKQ